MQVWSSAQVDSLEEEMATLSSILAWEISWTEEPGGLQSMGSQSQTQWTTEYEHNSHVDFGVSLIYIKKYLYSRSLEAVSQWVGKGEREAEKEDAWEGERDTEREREREREGERESW